MAFINQSEIDSIRKNVNIVDIIGSYIPLTKKGKNFFAICPFHDDHSPSMSVSEERQMYRCFTCEKSGNVFTFVEDYENVTFPEAVSIVASKAGITISTSFTKKKENKFDKYYEIMNISLKYYQNNLKTSKGLLAKKYLNKRNISEMVIEDFEIGLALDDKETLSKLLLEKGYKKEELVDLGLSFIYQETLLDQFSGRIIFPICNKDGQVVGFTGRIYRNEDSAKYINSKETVIFKKGELFYNYHLAKDYVKKAKSVILVEGQMDAIRLYNEGFCNVIATSGTSLTKDQISLLKSLKCKIILSLDSDNAGKDATFRIGEHLSKEGFEVYVVCYEGAKDPDEYIVLKGREAYQRNLEGALKFFDYKINYLKDDKNLDDSVDLANYINKVMSELNKESDEILREITINKISAEFGIEKDILKSKLTIPSKEKIIKENIPKQIKVKKDKYDLACEGIIYHMMNSPSYIKMFQKKLGFIPISKYRSIANEIMYYYELNKTIDMADFISFIANKEELSKNTREIIGGIINDNLNDNDMEKYLEIVRELINKKEIEKLMQEMKSTMDKNKKYEIGEKIAKIKKGSVNND